MPFALIFYDQEKKEPIQHNQRSNQEILYILHNVNYKVPAILFTAKSILRLKKELRSENEVWLSNQNHKVSLASVTNNQIDMLQVPKKKYAVLVTPRTNSHENFN